MADNTFYGTDSYVVRLMFDVYFQENNSFLGVETWFLGKGELVREIHEAQLFCSETKAITVFHACYRTLIKDFIKKVYDAKIFVRQWDGFIHLDSVYIKPSGIEQIDPIEVNNVKE